MRKALLVLAICMLAVPAWAGGGFSLFGSYSELTDDTTAAGVGARFSFGGHNWVGDLSWTWFASQENVDTIFGYEDKVQVIPTDLGIRYLFNTSGSFRPYVGAGVTFFYVNLNDGKADNTLGWYGTFGFNVGRGKAKFFAEALYRDGSTDAEYRLNPNEVVDGPMDVGGFGVNVGVAWGF